MDNFGPCVLVRHTSSTLRRIGLAGRLSLVQSAGSGPTVDCCAASVSSLLASDCGRERALPFPQLPAEFVLPTSPFSP